MKRFYFVTIFLACAVPTILSAVSRAHADPLPWLEDHVSDPFATIKKTSKLILPDLKPAPCPAKPDLSHKLPFNEVVMISICNNPDSKAAYLTLLSQAATYGTNYAGYLPTVTGDIERSRTTSFESPKSTAYGKSYGVSAGLTLYDFGQRELKLDAAEQTLIAAGYSYDSTLQGMIASALNGYFLLLESQQALDAAQESERYAKVSYDAAALRHKIGQVPVADELQAKGAYSQAILATEQARNNLSQSRAALALLMGLPPDNNFQVAEMDDSALTKDPFNGEVKTLMEQAQQKRVDLMASRAGVESSKIALRALERSDLATVTASVNEGSTNNNINIFQSSAARSQGIGISVSIPIFTGFSQTYNERAARESLAAQEAELDKSVLGVQQDVWNAWQNYQTAKQSWVTSWDLLASATQLKDVALGRYQEGLGTILDVLNAQSQYTSALQSQLQAHYSLLTTRVDLVRAVGVLDLNTMHPDTTIQVPASATFKE